MTKAIHENATGEKQTETLPELFQSVAELAPVGLFIIQDQVFCWVNSMFETNTGFSGSDLMGKSSLELVYPDDRAIVLHAVGEMLKGRLNAPYEYRLVTRGGDITWNMGMVRGFCYQGKSATLGVQMDISRQKRAEEALRLSEERSRTIIDSIADAYYEVNLSGNLLVFNKPYLKLFGYGASEMNHMNYRAYVDRKNAQVAYRAFNRVFKTGKPIDRMEWEIIHKNGEARRVELSVSLILSVTGAPIGFRGIISDVTERHRAAEAIRKQAFHDPLTGLANRILFNDRLLMAVKRAARSGNRVAVMIVDLDHFKDINDQWGHAAGDDLLSQVANRLLSLVRDSDTVGRHGGDEFAVVLSPLASDADARQVAAKIISSLGRCFVLGQQEVTITASIGLAVYPEDGDNYETLIKKADTAMYEAKEQGRNRYAFYVSKSGQP